MEPEKAAATEEVPADAATGDANIEEIEMKEDEKTAAEVASQVMRNPGVLAALQDKLNSMVGTPSGYIQSLPKVVKRRIKALKKLQFELIKIESKFYEQVHELECQYASKYQPFYEKRKEILEGHIEPTDSDCDWPSDEEDEEEGKLANKAKITEVNETGDKAAEEGKTDDKEEENPTGIPEFWLTIFKNVDMLNEMVQEHDEPILKHLRDITVKFSQADPMAFTLEFHFDSNEYFTNTVLTKEYIMRSEPDPEDPFSFEGPEIIKCKGCTIDWQKGKNVTVKVIKKTQKHKGRGTKRTVTKTVQNDSFFNFFNPPVQPETEDAVNEEDEDIEALLAADFEIGHFIRERIIPRAVLYFTGEALEDEEDDEFEDEGDEEEDDDDAEDDEDPDFDPSKAAAQQPNECKQQ